MADLPNGMGRDIHGDGDSVHGDEHSSDDGRSSAARSMPSYADSMASGFPGDLETNILGDTTMRPPMRTIPISRDSRTATGTVQPRTMGPTMIRKDRNKERSESFAETGVTNGLKQISMIT